MTNGKILVIGGTQMIGRDFVELCLENNIEPVLANRGITNRSLFKNLTHIQIDRNYEESCRNLKNIEFDIIIDFSCYNKDQLINILKNVKYNKYIILSTLCVFDNEAITDTKHWLNNYCLQKKILEEYIFNNKLNNFLIVRPCVLYGKHDYTNRFYEKNNEIYWKHNNEIVKESKYYIPVRKFSNYLYDYVFRKNFEKKSINIDLHGANYL